MCLTFQLTNSRTRRVRFLQLLNHPYSGADTFLKKPEKEDKVVFLRPNKALENWG
jgi:hypothetical protein